MRERRKDHFYLKAKREGYRSRASYKLLEINDKFRLFRTGARVVDLGAAPGGWAQVALEKVGPEGTVVGVDLAPIEPMEGVLFIRGDMTRADTIAATMEACGGVVDTVISDMSPNISGIYVTDQARSVHLATYALEFAEKVLRPGGSFVAKVFEGDLFPSYLVRIRASFGHVKVTSPGASRNSSSEVYVVGKGFQGPQPDRVKKVTWAEGDVIGDDLPMRRRRPPPEAAVPDPDDND